MQRVNFNCLNAGALKRLGQFYNVPEVQYGCSLDELAYAVAGAFTREVWLFDWPRNFVVCSHCIAWSAQVPDWRWHCAMFP